MKRAFFQVSYINSFTVTLIWMQGYLKRGQVQALLIEQKEGLTKGNYFSVFLTLGEEGGTADYMCILGRYTVHECVQSRYMYT